MQSDQSGQACCIKPSWHIVDKQVFYTFLQTVGILFWVANGWFDMSILPLAVSFMIVSALHFALGLSLTTHFDSVDRMTASRALELKHIYVRTLGIALFFYMLLALGAIISLLTVNKSEAFCIFTLIASVIGMAISELTIRAINGSLGAHFYSRASTESDAADPA